MVARRSYIFDEDRVSHFSELVGDFAPLHLDSSFSKAQGFRGRIVHGLFVQAIISSLLGEEVPGTFTVINSVTMKMHHPVLIGDTVDYEVRIVKITRAVKAVSLCYSGMVGEETVISGSVICSFPEPNASNKS